MKLSDRQEFVLKRVARDAADAVGMGNERGCEGYRIYGLEGANKLSLDALVRRGLVRAFRSSEKTRRTNGGTSSSPDGFQLYDLTPAGTSLIAQEVYEQEKKSTPEARAANRLLALGLDPKVVVDTGLASVGACMHAAKRKP